MGFRGSRVQIPPSRLLRREWCYFRHQRVQLLPSHVGSPARAADTGVGQRASDCQRSWTLGVEQRYAEMATTAAASPVAMGRGRAPVASAARSPPSTSSHGRPGRNTRAGCGHSSSRPPPRRPGSASASAPSPTSGDTGARLHQPAWAVRHPARRRAATSPTASDPWADQASARRGTPSLRRLGGAPGSVGAQGREIHTTSAFRSRRWLVGRPRSASEQFRGYFPSFIDDAQHFLNDRNMEHRGQRGVTLVLPFFGPFARTVPKR